MSSRKNNLADTDCDRLRIVFDRTLETEHDSKDGQCIFLPTRILS